VLERLAPGHSEGSHRRRLREELAHARPHFKSSEIRELGVGSHAKTDKRSRERPFELGEWS
jgi:hypothetical protein